MTDDPFLRLGRPDRSASTPYRAKRSMTTDHSQRAHSKFSASGAERWFNCAGSVELSEGLPDKPSPWSIEGTEAHEVLEQMFLARLSKSGQPSEEGRRTISRAPSEMRRHAEHAISVILKYRDKAPGSEVLIETRIYLDFIHPEMFGTFDGAVVDVFGTLHVFDYKYGAGHAVNPKENLQMIFYAIGLAHRYHWNFKRVRVWIIQPRIKGYDGPLFWEVSTTELRGYIHEFETAVWRVLHVERLSAPYVEGSWCHFCKARSICPLKIKAKQEAASNVFKPLKPISKGSYEEIEKEFYEKEAREEKASHQKVGRRAFEEDRKAPESDSEKIERVFRRHVLGEEKEDEADFR